MYLLIFWVYTEDLEPWGELVEMMMVVEVCSEGSWYG